MMREVVVVAAPGIRSPVALKNSVSSRVNPVCRGQLTRGVLAVVGPQAHVAKILGKVILIRSHGDLSELITRKIPQALGRGCC